MTTFLLPLLHSHSLDSLLGPDRESALEVFNQLFCVSSMALLDDYKNTGASIREMGSLMQVVQERLRGQLRNEHARYLLSCI